MPDDATKQPEVKPDWIAPTEDLAAGTAGLIASGLLRDPYSGLGVAAAVKLAGQAIRAAIGKRFESRAQRFESEVFSTIAKNASDLNERLIDERFQEILFQNYRRAMEAFDPAVLPALARLTVAYRSAEPDSFFRAAGRLLQDVAADELLALREVLTAAHATDLPLVAIVSWQVEARWELRFSPPKPSNADAIIGTTRPPSAVAVLGMLRRVGLLFDEGRHGQDLSLEGEARLDRSTIERLLALVHPIDVTMFPATFDTE